MSTSSQTITQADINNLAQKLDQLGDVLSDKERTLLLAVFKLAGSALANRVQSATSAQSGQSETESGMRGASLSTSNLGRLSLSRGFSDAFASVGPSSVVVDPVSEVAGGVGIGIIW